LPLAGEAFLSRAAASEPIEGLFVARRGDALVGAVWVQFQPGKTASLLGPAVGAGEPAATADALLAAALGQARSRPLELIQALVETDAGEPADRLRAFGFNWTADLLYLVSETAAFPTSPPQNELTYEPYSNGQRQRMTRIIERTYQETRDCPALNGRRDVDDVLAGYAAVGAFDPARWLFARHGSRDVGCLLLADHPGDDQWELVYMGLEASARGRGWGFQLARHAQWMTACAGRPRLVLAVDAANAPALSVYVQAGFSAWDRRSVLVKLGAA
jgi:ribosomal protein S18 acetylase RimI-like enzyme